MTNGGKRAGGDLRRVLAVLPPRRRRQFAVSLVLMLVGAVAELATIGAVIPFLSLLGASTTGRLSALLPAWLPSDRGELILWATGLLAVLAALSAAIRLYLTWYTQRFVFGVGHELGVAVYERVLRQPYSLYISRNSAEVIAGVEKVQSVIFSLLLPAMQALVALFMSAFIIALLIAIDPVMAIVAASFMTALYLVVSFATRRLLRANSHVIAAMQTERVKQVQEGLGGLRDIILDRSHFLFVDNFRRLDRRLREAQTANVFVGQAPRFVVESAGIVMIAFLAYFLSQRAGGLQGALPMLGALALGAQRLLPLLQQAFLGYTQVVGCAYLLSDVVQLLDAPVLGDEERPTPVEFENALVLDQVSFAYPDGTKVLDTVSLTIKSGQRVGIVGETGSGKSTLLDIVMGLLPASAGTVRIDGHVLSPATRQSWQRLVAHVPQSIYLIDASIASNIAFGAEQGAIDLDRVRRVAQIAQIAEFIDQLPNGYETGVGERGVRLSGGQRQRIGIARALYKGAKLLVLDEATSALDDRTERAVVDAIIADGSGVTIIMIAHRLSSLRNCDLVARLQAGRIVDQGRFEDVIGGAEMSVEEAA